MDRRSMGCWCALGAALLYAAQPGEASACGCVVQQSTAQPVVQAGERIVFEEQNGVITAHIQIQYAGSAEDFGWLLPLPSVPELKLGSEELFTVLEARTAPTFVFTDFSQRLCGGPSIGCGAQADLAAGIPRDPGKQPTVAVLESSAGPYDYAVLRADDKQPMLDWLTTHRYFVPAGTDDAVDPYIRPGAFFLALKLRAGETTGAIQPVVVQYTSQYPMVPIVLTSVAAQPDMGVLVWVLGQSRAVPRNYQHVVINEEHLDWPAGAANYPDVVRRAIDEAEGHHAFVTEYAGTTLGFGAALADRERFGDRRTLETTTRATDYLRTLRDTGFLFSSILPILRQHFPLPEAARAAGVTDELYYADLLTSLERWDPEASFDPLALTEALWTRYVVPTQEAADMLKRHPKITRLFTVLSPEEMTKDPVFGWNPALPDVPNTHNASLDATCEDDYPVQLSLSDGRSYRLKDASEWSARVRSLGATPLNVRVEVLREEGPGEVVVDNAALLAASARDDLQGCGVTHLPRRPGRDVLLGFTVLLGLVRWAGARRRRRDARAA